MIIVLSLLTMTACSVVSPQQRGVRVSLGKASETVLQPGPHYWVPFFSGVKKVSVKIQKVEISNTEAVSKDTQQMKADIVVNFQIEAKDVVKIVKEFGNEENVVETILIPAVHEVLKQATAKKALIEVLSKRDEVKKEIDDTLFERMAKYGVVIKDVNIVNLTFSEEFSKSVERKMMAEQEAKQAEYLAEKANNEAKALINTARGQKEAQALLTTSLTPMIIQKLAVEKWDGSLPKVMGGNGATPFIDLKSLSK